MDEHRRRMREAITLEAGAQRRLLAGDAEAGRSEMRAAATAYRASWELAPPGAYGRLIGMLKAAVIGGGDTAEAAGYARAQVAEASSPAAWYVVALASLIEGDDDVAADAAAQMRTGGAAFERTAEAIAALAGGNGAAYDRALRAIVADFTTREEHLTGVPIADTALMLETLAEPRGLAARPESPLLP